MLELAIPLKENFQKSALEGLASWFSAIPKNAVWYVMSDYCFGDKTKKNDAVTFSILLNHDKAKNIKEYINKYAPKDIKSSRRITPEFLQYINSPVIFNVTFLVDRRTKFLKDYADQENMESFLPAFKEIVKQIDANSTFSKGFVESILKRASAFQKDFSGKNFNATLSRQIFLVATFVSLIFHYLNRLKEPSHIAWISDRDALIYRYDGFIYD